MSQNDYVLFLFSSPMQITSLVIDPFGTWDTDVSYWLGNVNQATIRSALVGTSYANLGGLGFGGEIVDLGDTQSAPRTVSVTDAGFYNALLFGARRSSPTETQFQDRFKIASLTGETRVPEPTALLLLGLGLVATVRRLARRER